VGQVQGSQVGLGVLWFDENDVLTDPTVITFEFKTPSGTSTTYTYGVDAQLVKIAVGKYQVILTASASGIWSWRFAATGTIVAALEGEFTVDQSILG
jgi:hypothetical protein